jgi:hypothetical protein
MNTANLANREERNKLPQQINQLSSTNALYYSHPLIVPYIKVEQLMKEIHHYGSTLYLSSRLYHAGKALYAPKALEILSICHVSVYLLDLPIISLHLLDWPIISAASNWW